ncbi:hypothetical protein AVDCRST_MAG92-1318 [uncultured Coleofasciculus sp.]|uniref:Uncharacterized protein n=1 Tax=uncultured Coleofasciculus sp. TaxID=1267456 RepID=A0A6J4I1A2_9CYAN|nr:hypothetical protein AVDCRST_MAG92-1318 [uncultured Coleofasciculus sp.]
MKEQSLFFVCASTITCVDSRASSLVLLRYLCVCDRLTSNLGKKAARCDRLEAEYLAGRRS